MVQLSRVGFIGSLGGIRGGGAPTIPDWFAAYASQDTIYSYIAGPHMAYYNGRTYTVFQGPKFDVYINVYVHATGAQLGPYFVRGAGLTADAHGIPSLLIDDLGVLHVFSGCHVSALLYTKSTNAEDASAWTNQTNVTSSATYPTVFQTSDDTIWIFYRAGGHLADWVYRTSTDHGATWSAATSIISGGTTVGNSQDSWYVHIVMRSDVFHFSFLWKDDTNGLSAPGPEFVHRYNIYYMKREANGDWVDIDGAAVATFPVTKTSANSDLRLLETQGTLTFANVSCMALDGSDNPTFLSVIGAGIPHTYYFSRWNGTSLDQYPITTTDYLFDDYNIEYAGGTTYKAYLVSLGSSGLVGDYGSMDTQVDRGGDVQEWTSTDNGVTWAQTDEIATAADVNSKYNSIRLGKDFEQPAKLVVPYWGGDINLTTFDRKIRIWGSSGFITCPMEAETKALLNRFTVTPSTAQQSMIDTIIRNLKNAGIWSGLDAYWELAVENQADSLLNWKGTSYTLVPQGNGGAGPTWEQYRGGTGNGTDSYYETNLSPTAAGLNFTRNSGQLSLWVLTNAQSNNADAGFFSGTSDLMLRTRTAAPSSDRLQGRAMNATTVAQLSVTDGRGESLIQRTDGSNGQFFKNGVAGTAIANASAALQASPTLWLGGSSGVSPQYSAKQISSADIGPALTAAQIALKYRCRYGWKRLVGAA